MRVLQISPAYKPAYVYGGPTMSVAMLCEQLVKAGCDISANVTTANGKTELDVIPNKTVVVDGVNVTYFKRITKDHSHFSPALLKAVWKTAKSYDVVQIHAWWNLVSVLSCLIALMRNVPVLVSARGTLSPYSFQNKNQFIKKLIHNFISKPLLNRCHFHATSAREHDAIKSLISPKTITILPNFVKLPGLSQTDPNLNFKPLKLIFLSRIEEKKGLEILLDALIMVKVPYHLTIAGDGDQRYVESLKKMAADNGIADNITWAGFVNDGKFGLLQQHHLFILPSYDENFGNVVVESLSVGTAVLLSEEVGLAKYVAENKLGWVCKLNPSAVALAITGISGKENELIYIRQKAPAVIYEDFGNDSLVEKYIGLYTKIAQK